MKPAPLFAPDTARALAKALLRWRRLDSDLRTRLIVVLITGERDAKKSGDKRAVEMFAAGRALLNAADLATLDIALDERITKRLNEERAASGVTS